MQASWWCLSRIAVLVSVATFSPRFAWGDEEAAPPHQHDVHFEAGHMQIDPETARLLLSQGFVVQADRYRLTGDAVSLTNSPSGVLVDGQGRVAFCPCATPIITFGFSSATVAPPSDLVLKNAVVRVGPLPVLWLPYLWLRSPKRSGLIPPRFAYRAEEGLLATTGIHLPFGTGPNIGETSLDLRAGGYLRGGAMAQASLSTPKTATVIEADYALQKWVYDVDARGALGAEDEPTLAWDADFRAGARASRSSVLLDDAAVQHEHARAELATLGEAGGVQLGPRAALIRGEAGTSALVGPATSFSIRRELAPGMSVQTSADLAHLQQGAEQAQSFGRSLTELSSYGRLSQLGIQFRASELFNYFAHSGDASWSNRVRGGVSVASPWVAEFPANAEPLRHLIEPNLVLLAQHSAQHSQVSGRQIDVSQSLSESPGASGASGVAAVGVKNSLGFWAERRAAELSLASGWVGSAAEPTLAYLGKLKIDMGWVVGSSATVFTAGAAQLVSEVAVGRLGQPRVALTHALASASSAESAAALGLELESWAEIEQPVFGWLSSSGQSLGAEANLPIASWLAVSIAADADVGASQVLAGRSAIAYRHPCGCLAVGAWAGRRIARKGTDAWVTLDLLP